jgi:hypothetical protein
MRPLSANRNKCSPGSILLSIGRASNSTIFRKLRHTKNSSMLSLQYRR